MVTCFDAGIKSDIRFALPNRLSRIGTRSEGAKLATSELRARFSNRPLLLTTPGSVNWRTGGLSDAIDVTTSSDPVWVLDCDEGHALITTEIEAPRLEADFGVQALGWDVLTVPWYDAHAPLTTACSYAHVDSTHLLSDTDAFGTKVRNGLVMSRLVLGEAERDEMRELGVLVGAALGAGIDAWRPGITTDFESAATISRALEADGAKAVCLIVGGDDRLRSFRHPMA
ncbi:MAG TPA: hypothetical protein VII65_03625, partial [Acidimicrobiales bacterium]